MFLRTLHLAIMISRSHRQNYLLEPSENSGHVVWLIYSSNSMSHLLMTPKVAGMNN